MPHSPNKQIISIRISIDEKFNRECIRWKSTLLRSIVQLSHNFPSSSKKTLFKFDKSTHMPQDSSSKEHKRNASDISNEDQLLITAAFSSTDRKKSDKSLVCTPNPALIRVIYLPLLGYIEEIDELMKSKTGQPSAFNEFLGRHVKNVFLEKGHDRSLLQTIESLSKNHDAWRAIITPEEMKSLGLSRPLLQSTVIVENSE